MSEYGYAGSQPSRTARSSAEAPDETLQQRLAEAETNNGFQPQMSDGSYHPRNAERFEYLQQQLINTQNSAISEAPYSENPFLISQVNEINGQLSGGVTPFHVSEQPDPYFDDGRGNDDHDDPNPPVPSIGHLYTSTRPIMLFAVGGAVNLIYRVIISRDGGSNWIKISNILRQPSVNQSPYYEVDITTIVNSYIQSYVPHSLAKNTSTYPTLSNYLGGFWVVKDGAIRASILCTGEAYDANGFLTYDPDESNWLQMFDRNWYIDANVQHHETKYRNQKRWLEDYHISDMDNPITSHGRRYKFLTNSKMKISNGFINECRGFDDYLSIFYRHELTQDNPLCMWALITTTSGGQHYMPISNRVPNLGVVRGQNYFMYDVGINWVEYIISNGYLTAGIVNNYSTIPPSSVVGNIARYEVWLGKWDIGLQEPDHTSNKWTEKREYRIVENSCCGKGFQRIFWKNQKGGIDGITFRGAKENMTMTSNEIWERALGHREVNAEEWWQVTGNQYGVLNDFHQRTQQKQKINLAHTESVRLVSHWLKRDELEWCKEIVTSPLVWTVQKEDKHWTPQYGYEDRTPILITSAEIVWSPLDENLGKIEIVYNEQKQITQR